MLLAAGAIGGLIVAGQPWWLLEYAGGTATVTGTEATAGLPQALAAVLGAGALLGLTLRVVGRRILAVVLVLVGLGMVILAVVAPPPNPELVSATLQRTTLDVEATVVRGPWVAGFGVAAAFGLAGALVMLLRAGHWRSRADRFTRGSEPTVAGPEPVPDAEEDPTAVWKALDAGQDPTDADDGGESGERPDFTPRRG